ncbi:hypothetical protein L596_009415 [Steinernema carpocapsae]|uniref:Uncharacterized protein n=1 Tax=Steinernema carpocapsae TaxID=34508 RepID=A0A4U5PFH0_STECR|nr:hypothetical protein L596_009415 [Steinernema carpocapsae]
MLAKQAYTSPSLRLHRAFASPLLRHTSFPGVLRALLHLLTDGFGGDLLRSFGYLLLGGSGDALLVSLRSCFPL